MTACLLLVLACAHRDPVATELPDGTWAYVDRHGVPTSAARYRVALDYLPGGIAQVHDEQGWAVIDRQGRLLLRPLPFDNGPDYFVEGLARYVDGGRVGYFDERGRVVIPARFEHALPFESGRARVGEACVATAEGEHTRVDCARWWSIDRTGAEVP